MPDDVFRWLIAIGVLLCVLAFLWQGVLLFFIYRAIKEARQADVQGKVASLFERADVVIEGAMLTLASAKRILEENRPRIAEISTNAVAVANTARQQSERIGELIDEANQRTRARLEQLDRTVDQAVAQVEHVRDTVTNAVNRPVREVRGVMAGIRAAVAAYAQDSKRHSVEHVTQDEEMFI